MMLTFSRISAEFYEKREADDGNQCRHHDRDQQNHRTSFSAELRKRGDFVCVQYRGRPLARLSKPSVQTDGIPTKWSVRFFLKSLQRFGQRTRHHISRRLSDARSALRSAIWVASVIGPVTLSRRSSPKFSGATECGTSRSFPNGDRRPF